MTDDATSGGEGIVPEGFDLRKALYSSSTTPPHERKRCPECKKSGTRKKCGKPYGARENETEYYCPHCNNHFDEPIFLTKEEVEELQGINS